MKNKLPRKYKITCRVRPLDAPENFASSRYVGMHNGDAGDSRRVCRSDAPENLVSLRYVGMHNRFADDSRRVRRSDAPENIALPRYVGMHNGDGVDTKMAETLVLSGFSPPPPLYLSPVRLSTLSTVINSTQIACPPLAGWTKSTFIPGNPLKADDHRYVIPQRSCCEPRKAVALRDLKQKNDTS